MGDWTSGPICQHPRQSSGSTTNEPISQALIQVASVEIESDETGHFELQILTSASQIHVSVTAPAFRAWEKQYAVPASRVIEIGSVSLSAEVSIGQISAEDIIPTITLSTDVDASAQNISGLLTASRDVFISTAHIILVPIDLISEDIAPIKRRC